MENKRGRPFRLGPVFYENLQVALAAGENTFQGPPCPAGHDGIRYVTCALACVKCVQARNEKRCGRVATEEPSTELSKKQFRKRQENAQYQATGFFRCHNCGLQKSRSKLDKNFVNRQQCTDCTSANNERKQAYAGHVNIFAAPARLYVGASL